MVAQLMGTHFKFEGKGPPSHTAGQDKEDTAEGMQRAFGSCSLTQAQCPVQGRRESPQRGYLRLLFEPERAQTRTLCTQC